MNEWPTLVRTGLPPCSVTISGTACDVIRLWITMPPGSLTSSRVATSAVTGARLAALVHHETAVGVTVEGQADVGAGLTHLGLEIHDVLRVQRVGLVVGEV